MKNNRISRFAFYHVVKLAVLLAALCVVTFTLLELSPIDPVTAYVGADTRVGPGQR